jgi:glycine/D-amino acid oxidase-like deaminating enzyme
VRQGDPEAQAEVFWQRGVRPRAPRRRPPRRADVAVLGGGLTGVSAALTLAEAGASVVLLERGRLGDGASGRNGGQVLTGVNLSFSELTALLGSARARAVAEEGLAAVRHVAWRIGAHGIACGWHQGGHIEAVRRPAELERLAAEREELARLGYDQEVLDADALTRLSGAEGYAGGLLDRVSGGLNPYLLVLGLAEAARRAGACLVEGTACVGLERRSGRLLLHLEGGGVLEADAAIAALNGYAPRLFPDLHRRLRPRLGSVAATEALPPDAPVLPGRTVLFEGWPSYFYVQRTAAGSLVFGGRTPAGEEGLGAELGRRFPAAGRLRIVARWRGLLALSRDFLPHVGRYDDGVFYALGYSGHGVALSVHLGSRVAHWVAGGAAPEPWVAIPFPTWRRGRPVRARLHPALLPVGPRRPSPADDGGRRPGDPP